MNKLAYSLLLVPFLALSLQAEGEWRWGVSLGTGSISFENEEGSANGTTGLEADYNPSIFGFDVSDGTVEIIADDIDDVYRDLGAALDRVDIIEEFADHEVLIFFEND